MNNVLVVCECEVNPLFRLLAALFIALHTRLNTPNGWTHVFFFFAFCIFSYKFIPFYLNFFVLAVVWNVINLSLWFFCLSFCHSFSVHKNNDFSF